MTSYDWTALLRAQAAGDLAAHLDVAPLPIAGLLDEAPLPGPDEPYGRRPIFRGTVGEVLLVRWQEDTFCAPHDHGDASGQVLLLRGHFTERLWRLRQGELEVASERTYQAPATIAVHGGAIHDMKARQAGVGLHLYLPAIHGMRVFDRARREVLIVSDDCGAWVPKDTTLIEERRAW